ncbi:aldo/keto reductase [Fonticella tunisiensis]|uniref:Putative aldo/keto reductase-like oxidoreductase n=1 Tax=Fonticella tunisiensis TaxID=1096341 RepID=A0A4R7KUA7_9CLOT|nr:aldo/keto reductase [Fonticella tunisiensis]TDT63738.1 putative aldo/keto reductase-like oxidoreductase [Fonticella tunisiensis]
MIYRELGKTGLKVSAVGFGGIPIQRVAAEEAVKVIHRAEELGINFIDTARGYSVSEEYIGHALKGRRDKWIIATKSMERTREGMLKDIDISLKNLQTDYIDLYQIHNVKEMETYNQVVSKGGALKALVEAKKLGKIRHIGITAHSLDTLKVAIESGLFETVMYPYNIIERQAEGLFKRAKELNMGTIAMKPMAGGALNNGYLAVKFILQNENISVVIPGMATIKEVEENASPAENLTELTQEEERLCQKIASEMGETFCRRCGYCAPCPQGIDIPFSFILKAYYDNYDLKGWSMERYKGLKAHASNCKECGICEGRCPYNLPIRSMLKEVRNTFGI